MTTNARQFAAKASRAPEVLGVIPRELVPAINIDAQIVGDLERAKSTALRGKAASGSPS